jgi:hypothetical protein
LKALPNVLEKALGDFRELSDSRSPYAGVARRLAEGGAPGAEKMAKLGQGAATSWCFDLKLASQLIAQTSKEEDSHRLIPFRLRSDPSPML